MFRIFCMLKENQVSFIEVSDDILRLGGSIHLNLGTYGNFVSPFKNVGS